MLSAALSLLAVSLLAVTGADAAANQLVQVTNYGTSPTNAGMYVYKPTKLANPLPLIVAIHYCGGTAQAYFTGTQYATLADTYGYIVVYPSSPNSGTCWDVSSTASLTHNGGSDSLDIASMVSYSIATYGVSASHVYVTGTSSGAMMTNVMAATYPELFQAASLYSGVAYYCFAGNGDDVWNSACSTGTVSKTAAQWGALVAAAYPGYTGSRPKMMIWHGTADTTLYYENYGEEIKEWTYVLGVSQTPTTTTLNNPDSGYTKTTYGDQVIGYSAAGVGHTVPVHEAIDLAWFGITGTTTSSSSSVPPVTPTSTSTTPSTTNPTTTTSQHSTTSPSQSPTGGIQAKYGQCGGIGWTGPTQCVAGTTCKYSNDWYSQCL